MSDPNQSLRRPPFGRPTPSVNLSVAGILPRLRLTPHQDDRGVKVSAQQQTSFPRACQVTGLTATGQTDKQQRGLLETIKTVVSESNSGEPPVTGSSHRAESVLGEITTSLLDQSMVCSANDTTVIGPPPNQRQSVSLTSGLWRNNGPGRKMPGAAPPIKKGVSFCDPLDKLTV